MVWLIVFVVLFVASYIAAKIYYIRRGKEIIECRECHFLMTRDDVARKKGCPRCGSRYFIEVGEHDKRK
jgi:Zn finger protein HypA/HybF involved in hydrogenase expression